MALFESDSQRLVVAADFRPNKGENPIPQAQAFLEKIVDELSGMNVTVKINTVARILGGRALELLNDNGLACFLDLKLSDISNTLQNDASWIEFYEPLMVTVMERVKPAGFRSIQAYLPNTMVMPVGPLTDLDDDDFRHFDVADRNAEVVRFFNRIRKLRVEGTICAPTDIKLAPKGFRDSAIFATPAVKPAWTLKDDNSMNALTPRLAIEAGADIIIVGRGITEEDDIRDATKRTLDELFEARDR